MDAFGIFQGGGAKGYAHVGALKAAEQRGIRFVRIAGTSAGAIIAALAAAGYTADELLDAMDGRERYYGSVLAIWPRQSQRRASRCLGREFQTRPGRAAPPYRS